MTLPRQVLPKTTYLLTRRTNLRQLLLRPSKMINQIFLYCLAIAAKKYEVQLHAACVLSNHRHIAATDTQGRLPEFEGWLNAFMAKVVNASLGRWEALWAPGSYSAQVLETPEDTLEAMTYIACNPVKAALVTRCDLWPGVNILPSDLARTVTVKRPPLFFRSNGGMPDEVELTFVAPPGFEHASLEAFRAQWLGRIQAEEERLQQQVRASGRGFLGRRAVRLQDPFAFAHSRERRRGLKPRVKCRDSNLRVAAIKRLQRFCADYREAFLRFRDGFRQVLFPPGTYWMRVHAGVCCAPAPP